MRPRHDATRRADQVDARRLGGERHRTRGARVRLEDVELAVADRELHVQKADDAEGWCERRHDRPDLCVLRWAERRRRKHAGRVAGMHARLFDVLHHRADEGVASVRDCVDVDLDRALDEPVDE